MCQTLKGMVKITQVTRAEEVFMSGFCHMRDFKELTDRGATVTLPFIQKL